MIRNAGVKRGQTQGLAIDITPVHSKAPLIVAHRGASADAPENTLAAFELAWQQGADAIEGDFRLTADQQIVCIHDADTQRVAGVNHVISETSLSALRTLDVGSRHGQAFADTSIPTLTEVLACVPPGKRIYLELKGGRSIVGPLLAALEASGLNDEQIVIISFDEEVVEQIKRDAARYTAYWVTSLRMDSTVTADPSPQEILRTLAKVQADGVGTSAEHVDPHLIQSIQQRGYTYHVWTVDQADAARRFATWGVDSITTNRPGRIRDAIDTEARPLDDRACQPD